MASYLIYTDSAADLPKEDYEKYDIRIIPMDYMLNGKSITFYTNDPDHDKYCEELFEAEKNDADVTTAQITPYHYVETWTKDLEAGNDILYLSMSSGLSATFDNALMAAQQLGEEYPNRKVRVVDSLSGTCGQGIVTITAAINRDEKGMELEENALWLEEHIPYVCHRFIVGDLHYLHKGGRVSKASAVVGSMLNIKPGLIIDDTGKLEVVTKTRGKNAAMKKLVDSYVRQAGIEGVPEMIFCDYGANKEDIPIFEEMIRSAVGPDIRIEFICVTPILGVHVGSWFLSICGWGKKRKED